MRSHSIGNLGQSTRYHLMWHPQFWAALMLIRKALWWLWLKFRWAQTNLSVHKLCPPFPMQATHIYWENTFNWEWARFMWDCLAPGIIEDQGFGGRNQTLEGCVQTRSTFMRSTSTRSTPMWSTLTRHEINFHKSTLKLHANWQVLMCQLTCGSVWQVLSMTFDLSMFSSCPTPNEAFCGGSLSSSLPTK